MKNRIMLLPVLLVTGLLLVLPMHAAYADHANSMGSPFWHSLDHVLTNAFPLLFLASVGVVVMWYLRKTERP